MCNINNMKENPSALLYYSFFLFQFTSFFFLFLFTSVFVFWSIFIVSGIKLMTWMQTVFISLFFLLNCLYFSCLYNLSLKCVWYAMFGLQGFSQHLFNWYLKEGMLIIPFVYVQSFNVLYPMALLWSPGGKASAFSVGDPEITPRSSHTSDS